MQFEQRVVVMDSDGEDLPAAIPSLLALLESAQVDVVVAQRKSRVETFRFKAFYAVYKRFFSLMTGRAISFGNFMALKPAAVKRLVAMQELSIHVAGAVLASKLRTSVCPLDRGPRYAGQSKMNFVGLALHGFKALMVFAEDVLVRVGIATDVVARLEYLTLACLDTKRHHPPQTGAAWPKLGVDVAGVFNDLRVLQHDTPVIPADVLKTADRRIDERALQGLAQ